MIAIKGPNVGDLAVKNGAFRMTVDAAADAADYVFEKEITFQLLSSFFGGAANKYLPLSSVNGLRIILTLDRKESAFTITDGTELLWDDVSIQISDPTFFMNTIRIDPALDQRLLSSTQDPDGKIRLHNHSWQQFSSFIEAGKPDHEYVINVKKSSLKAIFFTFVASALNSGYDTFNENTIDQGTNMKTTFVHNNLKDYQIYIDGVPTPATPVKMGGGDSTTAASLGYSEMMAELSRALHFGHKSGDGDYLSLLAPNHFNEFLTRNFVCGFELESWGSKSDTMDTGMNTQNSVISLRLNFYGAGGTPANANLRVWCMYDMFVAMTPNSGIIEIQN
mmetsp:Transcript_25362/g.31597  ORF Transcript_25362/g.31597 Transcript_25362/m.31597 type:complete len:335 (+) Transcript_25362:631-1635(+)